MLITTTLLALTTQWGQGRIHGLEGILNILNIASACWGKICVLGPMLRVSHLDTFSSDNNAMEKVLV